LEEVRKETRRVTFSDGFLRAYGDCALTRYRSQE